MWESPIYVYTEDDITRKITKEVEGYIITETKKVVPYINKEELLKALEYDRNQYEKGYADGRESAIKHGHWINKGFEPTRCSVCGITVDAINGIPWAIKSFKYCPYCGAKMDEVTDEADKC